MATPTITVYTKPSCTQCKATYRELDRRGADYVPRDITKDPEALAFVKELGYLQAPVVTAEYPNGDTHHWGGFRPDKIQEHLG